MKKTEKAHQNIDIPGDKWILAPYGSDIVHAVKMHLFDIRAELLGYSTLFKNLNTDALDQEGLYGIGLTLNRMSARIGRLSDRLEGAVIQESETTLRESKSRKSSE